MRKLCAKLRIAVTAFSTLGSPGSSADKKTKEGKSLPRLLDHPTVKAIAERQNRTAAQVLLRHAVQKGIVVLPKSNHPGRIKENIGIFDFSLTDAEVEDLNNLNRGEKGRIFNFLADRG
jgi:alcohol dehydrogenase (NADP+)